MKLSIECLPCLLGQAVRLAKVHIYREEVRQGLLKKVLKELADLEDDASALYAAQRTTGTTVETTREIGKLNMKAYPHWWLKYCPHRLKARIWSLNLICT